MTEAQPARPKALKILGYLFLLWSVLTIALNLHQSWFAYASRTSEFTFHFDLGAGGFLATIGLARLSRLGRYFALVLTCYWLIGAGLLFLELYPVGRIKVTSTSDFLAHVPKAFLRIFVVPFFFTQLWQLYTLQRGDIRALFYQKGS